MKLFTTRVLSLITALTIALGLSGTAFADFNGPLIMPAPPILIAPAPIAPAPEPTADINALLKGAEALLQSGYTDQQVKLLLANLSPDRLILLSRQSLQPQAADYAALDYFREELLDRYLAYGQLHPEYDAETVVTYVNIGLDQERYTFSQPAADPDSLTVLVNQYNALDMTFVPQLVVMDSAYTTVWNDRLHPDAYDAFTAMADAACLEGLTLRSVSAYRSYETQQALYDRYAARDGVAAADRYSAHPGYSEHQTGLALDINVAGSRYHFESGSEYQWLMDHCWEYGFILRYPSEKTSITGFIFEPWHYRYVGQELAAQLRDSGLTYDEYVARTPVKKQSSLPTLFLDGTQLTFETMFFMEDRVYLDAEELVRAMGGSCYLTGEVLKISTPRLTLSVSTDSSKLSSPSAVWKDRMYLELNDLIALLHLYRWDSGQQILLSTRAAAPGWTFTDVLPYHDSYEDALYVWRKGLFSGTSQTTFAPDTSLTRAMAVTVLQKLDRSNTPAQAPDYPDVTAEAWYVSGVAWADAVGMVSGYPDGMFRPDNSLTREEAAMILYKFARHMGCPTYTASVPQSVSDASMVSDWASGAAGWAVRSQLLPLREGLLSPQQPITRAEMAHALALLCRNYLS